MATFNEKYKGWEWTVEERRSRQPSLRAMRNAVEKIGVWDRWIHRLLPQYGERAAKALAHLTDGLGQAAEIDLSNRARKYQPLSPEQFDAAFARLADLLRSWRELSEDPAFVADYRVKSREVKAHNAAVRAQESLLAPLYDMAARGDAEGALKFAAEKGLL